MTALIFDARGNGDGGVVLEVFYDGEDIYPPEALADS